MQKTVAIIPARYASTRFPGKPLALLGGKPVIQWVWENVSAMPELACAVVATDDERIAEAVKGFGGRAVMTASTHRSGTDRCGEVVRKLREEGQAFDVAINVQGDEPFVRQEQLRSLVDCFADGEVQIATLKTAIHSTAELMSPNNVKVVCDLHGRALYFSRQPLPHLRGVEPEQWTERHPYFKHVGIYAFRTETLEALVRLQQSPLELCESLEQLRWLENGYEIQVKETAVANIGIDTPADMALAEQYLTKEKNN
jgi:3-deoxy-manno-octulosonate cytidylyltransferase (CMP-KDO synthetase)